MRTAADPKGSAAFALAGKRERMKMTCERKEDTQRRRGKDRGGHAAAQSAATIHRNDGHFSAGRNENVPYFAKTPPCHAQKSDGRHEKKKMRRHSKKSDGNTPREATARKDGNGRRGKKTRERPETSGKQPKTPTAAEAEKSLLRLTRGALSGIMKIPRNEPSGSTRRQVPAEFFRLPERPAAPPK